MGFVRCSRDPRYYICTNAKTYRIACACLISRRVPAAYLLARWVMRNGGAVNSALRLQLHRGRGCCLAPVRRVAAGKALASIPLSLTLSTVTKTHPDGNRCSWEPLEELATELARELHNPRSFHRRYVEFLHDIYNSDDTELASSCSLQNVLDGMYRGNALVVLGVNNAPFLEKSSLTTTAQRAEWVRVKQMLRRMEQSLPHFAAKSASWALSMALSRALPGRDGSLMMAPIIDFSLHNFDPNALLLVAQPHSEKGREIVGVRWHDESRACVHLVARRAIAVGEPVSILYSPRGVTSVQDAEYWKMRWGFIPKPKEPRRS
ncbi:hypothetical protein TRVL_04812 [Trypanosoma vivax]|nr:hypothetical protein TRVL_04812 [Trypanosoma vivax]